MDSFLSTLTYIPADGLALAYTSNGQAMPMDELVKKNICPELPLKPFYFATPINEHEAVRF